MSPRLAVAAAPPALGPPAPNLEITLEELLAREIVFPVPQPAKQVVYVEEDGNTEVAERCVLDVVSGKAKIDDAVAAAQPACREIFKLKPGDDRVVHHGDPTGPKSKLAVEPIASAGLTLTWVRKKEKRPGTNSQDTQLVPPLWPKWLRPATAFHAQFGEEWIRGAFANVNNRVGVDPSALVEKLKTGGPIDIFAKLSGKKVKIQLKGVDDGKKPSKEPKGPGELAVACNDKTIRAEARAAVGIPLTPPAKLPRERKLLLGDWYYIVCYDLTEPNRPKTVTVTEPAKVAKTLHKRYERRTSESPTLLAGHDVVVVVWAKPGTEVGIEFGGTASYGSTIFVPDGLKSEIKGLLDPGKKTGPSQAAKAPHKVQRFAPRGGEILNITIKGERKEAGKDTKETVFEYKQARRMESLYRGAIRLGVAFAWAPFERTYKARTASGGARYIDFASGDDPAGLFDAELMFGYTVFFRLLPSLHRGAGAGWYFGAGLVKAGSQGVSILSSIHTGPELTIGRHVGIAFTGSLRRTRWLGDGHRVGEPLAAGDDPPTRFGVTPAFSIVLSLQPGIFKTVGKVAGGDYKLFGGGSG